MSYKVLSRDRIISKLQNIHLPTLLLCMNTAIFLAAICSIAVFLFVFFTTELDLSKDKYFKQGFEHKEFLLSSWATSFHIIYFGIYSLIDVIVIFGKKSKQIQKITKILDNVATYFLFSIVFPLTTVTSIMFWMFYYWDKERMYPKQMEVFPNYLNHMMHTFPLPITVLYMFAHVRKEPHKYKTLPPLIILMVLYLHLIFDIRRRKGLWVYPVFEFLTFSQVQCISAITFIAIVVCHFLGYYLFNILKDLRSSIASNLSRIESNFEPIPKNGGQDYNKNQ